jgi:predicted transcriptional regulator
MPYGHGGDRHSAAALQRYSHPGNQLWEYRAKLGLTQGKLAERFYVTQQSISDMERGRTPIMPHIKAFLDEQGGKQK